MGDPEKPFGDREEVKKDILLSTCISATILFCSIVFVVLGVIGDALNITLGLESMSWFLLAIWTGLIAIFPGMASLTAKHLYGIESERKE
jgi:hypothetical protein